MKPRRRLHFSRIWLSHRESSVSVPPHVKDGTEMRIATEDIGLRDVSLNLFVRIDPSLDEEW